MRQLDQLTVEKYDTPSILLMEAAADSALQAIASRLQSPLRGKKARILCGPGNNGGDGAALARALCRAGVQTDVVLFGRIKETKGDANINFTVVQKLAGFAAGSTATPSPLSFTECESIQSWEDIARPRGSYDVIVDALFGTGLTRPLAGVYIQVIEHLALIRTARERKNSSQPLIVALDIPSGLNADSAELIGEAVEADLTVTFTAAKVANVLPPAAHHCGELVVSNIGTPAALVEAAGTQLFVTEECDARDWLIQTRYSSESYKNTHGHALIVAGSRDYAGAAALCGNAAIKSGAGLVTIATPLSAQPHVVSRSMPEVITTSLAETDRGTVSDEAAEYMVRLQEKATVIALGPGLSAADERTRRFVYSAVQRRSTPMVIDADGLNSLAPWPAELRGSSEAPLVLTPHPGEMLRLLGATEKSALSDRVTAVRQFASAHELILVLKGSRSLIAAPDGRVFVNPTGNPGLGTAGSGDTLTGIIAGFLAQAFATLKEQANAFTATIAALYVAGLAGDIAANEIGMRTMVASDVTNHLGAAVRLLDPRGEAPR